MAAAPAKVRAKAEQAARDRFVTRSATGDPAAAWISARLDRVDALFLDATVDRLADILGEQGDERLKDHRRATALGLLATPAVALSMLGVHTRRGLDDGETMPIPSAEIAATPLPTTQVYVHLGPDALLPESGDTVARVEKLGPIFVSQLSQLVGHSRIRLTRVVHLPGSPEPVVDAYEVPDRIREQIILRDGYEPFPYSCRDARGLDADHTVPYIDGVPGQTRPSNLEPLSRRVHRAKTHCGWKLDQPSPGVFRWTTGLGQQFTIGPDGTTDDTDTTEHSDTG